MTKLIISCEHASNQIPSEYSNLFNKSKRLLQTHAGYDIGAKQLADKLQIYADASFIGEYSRLLIDLNRSLHHPSVFSMVTKNLEKNTQQAIIQNYYLPYREAATSCITKLVKHEVVLHLSIHSFTPELSGIVRNTDIGLLYDPKRINEKHFAKNLKSSLIVRTRLNYPYRGIADGFVTHLRKCFSADKYIGLEIEVNQKFFTNKNESQKIIKQIIKDIETTFKLINF